tara:strand:- start:27 stop:812 length:786 start_codon:yes stop_codon:yes gene_type:complete
MVDVGNLFDSSIKQERYTFDLSCNIFFITFGNEKFKNSRERIINEAKNIGIFNKCFYETEDIINDEEFVKALKYKEFRRIFSLCKGFGYWMWKPYIIYKNLCLLNDNDILVYCDSGSSFHINPILKLWSKQKFYQYFNEINNNKGCLSFSNGSMECEYTKSEVFKYFNVENNLSIINTDQREAGFHVIRKCDFTMKIYERWWTLAKKNPELFDDSICKVENNFKENRHDQSIWSLICKTMEVPLCKDTPSKRPVRHTRIKN